MKIPTETDNFLAHLPHNLCKISAKFPSKTGGIFPALKSVSGSISHKGDKEKHGTPEMLSEVVGRKGGRQNGETDDKAPHAGEIEP